MGKILWGIITNWENVYACPLHYICSVNMYIMCQLCDTSTDATWQKAAKGESQ